MTNDVEVAENLATIATELAKPDNSKWEAAKTCLEKNINAKKYEVITPNGEIIVVFNLSKYCRQNNLNVGHLSSVANGNRKHHKGYGAKKI